MGMVGLRDVFVVAPASSFHPHHHYHHDSQLPATEHPIIPLLTATPCLVEDSTHHDASRGRVPSGIHLWQNQQNQSFQNPNHPSSSSSPYLRKHMPMMDPGSTQSAAAGLLHSGMGGGGGGVMGVVGPGSSAATCQDCGNQAKKDCSHRRCRTCCKSRGFDCTTHVKSTWVPAARRRERQLSSTAAIGAGSSASTSSAKKPRLITSHATTTTTTASHTSTSNTTPPRSFDTSSSHQDVSFRESLPRQVRAPATFKCVRVTSIDDGEDQYAYQAMVKIGGHLFKGFLYDQGMEDRDINNNENGSNNPNNTTAGGNDNSSIPNISELHLGGGGPSDVYAAPVSSGGLIGGTAFGNPIN